MLYFNCGRGICSGRRPCGFELTFKRSCEIADHKGESRNKAAFLLTIASMDICVYSDESGVFDWIHNDYFVFGGVLFLSHDDQSHAVQRYLKAEEVIRKKEGFSASQELKACVVSNEAKSKLFRSLNPFFKFGVVVHQKRVLPSVFAHKKSKQRYLDYVFKIATKRKFEKLIRDKRIDPNEVTRLRFYIDEHATATDGRYELQESLEREFKIGTFNQQWSKFYPPIFPNLVSVDLKFCDSKVKPLIRAADIVANKIYHSAIAGDVVSLTQRQNILIIGQP